MATEPTDQHHDPEPIRPEAARLLKHVQATDAPSRGRLKVYLGAAPGVGKTFEMLHEGRRLKAEGIDVVAGFVETHGRARLALPARQCLADTERVAEDLEIEVRDLPRADGATSVEDAVVRFVCDNNITHLMLMQAPRTRLDILLHGSLINHLLRNAKGVDLYVMPER